MTNAPDALMDATIALCECCRAKPKDVQLREVKAELRKLKKSLQCNEEVLIAMELVVGLPKDDSFVQLVQRAIENEKQLINCLNQIKEHLEP